MLREGAVLQWDLLSCTCMMERIVNETMAEKEEWIKQSSVFAQSLVNSSEVWERSDEDETEFTVSRIVSAFEPRSLPLAFNNDRYKFQKMPQVDWKGTR